MDKFLLEVISHFEIGKPTSINSITWEGWSSNKLYRVTTAKGTYVLKSKTSAQASENLTKATVIRQFLIDSGLETIPKPIPTHDLSLTYTDLNNICWELQECIEGINVDPENITRKHCESLATEIANYHKLFLNNEKLAKSFNLSVSKRPQDKYTKENLVKDLSKFESILSQNMPLDKKRVISFLEDYRKAHIRIMELIKNTDWSKFSSSLVHRDLPGNVLFSPNNSKVTGLIDWDECSYGFILSDIKSALDVCSSTNLLKEHFLKCYCSMIPLSNEEKDYLPIQKYCSFISSKRWWIRYNLKSYLEQENKMEEKASKLLKNVRKALDQWEKELPIIEL